MSQHYSVSKVKRSLVHFAFGKLGSGLLGFFLLLVTVRILSPGEFGTYVTLLSLFEIVQLVSSGGLFATTHRYITECRVNGSLQDLALLIRSSIYKRIFLLFLASIMLGLLSTLVQRVINTNLNPLLYSAFLIFVVAEGGGRFNDLVFESLLLQGKGQFSIIFRNGLKLILLCIAIFFLEYKNALATLMIVESINSVFGFLVSVLLLKQFISSERKNHHQQTSKGYTQSREKSFALNLYFSQVVGLGYGPDVVRILVAKFLGLIQAANFGFAYSIVSMLRRYLPAQLLLGLIRPLFVVVDAKSTQVELSEKMRRLNLMSNLVFKFNVFMLAPVILFFCLFGNEFGKLFSHGKYPDTGYLLVGFCFFLIMQTLHIVLGLVTVALQNSAASLKGTFLALLGLPTGLLLSGQLGAYGLMYGMIISEILWCVSVIFYLKRSSFNYQHCYASSLKIMLSTFLTALPFIVFEPVTQDVVSLVSVGILIAVLFLLISYVIKPFTTEERGIINRLLPKPLFIW